MDSLKVLISAYACKPGSGSDPGIAWDIAREMVKYHKVWVLTRESNRALIEAELSRNPVPGLNFVYYDLPFWLRWLRHQSWGIQIHYYLWQLGAYLQAKALHSAVNLNLIHHVSYIKYSSPSFLSLLPVPFIWGPIGGGESAPKSFWRDFSLRGKAYEVLRSSARWVGEHDPFVRLTARRSALAWATTEDTAHRLQRIGARDVQVLPCVGLPESEIEILAQYSTLERPSVRFISIGRVLHWKGFHLGLRAFAQAKLPDDAEYWILGEGPELSQLQVLAEELGISSRVKFWNRLPRKETLQSLGGCAALVHPSLHDSGGMVCLEAMAAGCPVICLDLGGPAVSVTHETGFKIPADSPEQTVQEIAKAMTNLAQDPDLQMRMGRAAQRRIHEVFSCSVRGQFIDQTYREIVSRKVGFSHTV